MADQHIYLCIDLKSFYASVECVEWGLDPLKANLVVADESRTEKTICLAVSPSLKAYGISGRARLFEVYEKIREIKARTGEEIEFMVAKPRMNKYIEVSTQIYGIYLEFLAPEDIYIYSIDEVFMDITPYLKFYDMTPKELATKLILEVYHRTGITATGGLGTNLYLAKIAMDIMAKHEEPNEQGVRVAALTEKSYRKKLWDHQPLTDFWRVGHGIEKRLRSMGMKTMGDIARMSLHQEDILYDLLGIDAEILIDHAWGVEPCTIADIKNYKPGSKSLGVGQVLAEPYPFDKAKLIMKEMTEGLTMDLVDQGLAAGAFVLTVGYDREATDGGNYKGATEIDRYGRKLPKSAHGTVSFEVQTSSTKKIVREVTDLFERIVDRSLTVRRIFVTAERLIAEEEVPEQLDLFTPIEHNDKEKKLQKTMIELRKKFGKNALVKGMDLEDGATAMERNGQVGGHKG